LIVSNLSFSPVSAEETNFIQELRKEVVNNSGFSINARIVQNKESKLQDLYILPAGEKTYPTGSFIHAVAQGVSDVTSSSFAYRLYTGMVIIDINGELWAISSENCRKIFRQDTVEGQNEMMQKSLKRLR
jgi:hypothetical protein